MKLTAMTILFALGAIFATGACTSDADGDLATGDDAEIKKAKPGELGGMCGGFAGLPCKGGLSCKIALPHPDASGTCSKPSPGIGDPGGTCGGIAGIQCKGGLECALESDNVDASGTCKKGGPGLGEPDGFCGGIAGVACKPGLSCQMAASNPDASGTCKPSS